MRRGFITKVFAAAVVTLLLAPAFAPSLAIAQAPPGKGFAGKGPPPDKQGEFRQAGHGGRRMHERMSPEERQQLRRDIHQHGRDIYRDRK